MADSCAKFEVSSISRCGDISQGVNSKMCHVILTTPLSQNIFHLQVGLVAINLQTKFEVSNYTHSEDMRSSAKCRNCGSLGRLGVT